MTNAAQEAWISGAVGRRVDWDNGSFDCVDVAKDYGQAIFGVDWRTLWPDAGNANGMFWPANPDFFELIPNDPNNPNQIPERGDIIIYGGNAANDAGHIAVVLAADTGGVLMIDQDSNEQRPMETERLAYDNQYTGPCVGWLRPKVSSITTQASNITPTTTTEDDVALTDDDIKRIWAGPAAWVTNRRTGKQEYAETILGSLEDRILNEILPQALKDPAFLTALAEAVVSHEFPWYGFDGKVPESGRTTTSVKTDLGWADARATGIFNATLAAVKGLADQVKNAPDTESGQAAYDKLVELIDGTVIALNVQKPATTN